MHQRPSEIPGGKKQVFPNPRDKSLQRLSHELHLKQLSPGKNLDDLIHSFANTFYRKIEDESLGNFEFEHSLFGTGGGHYSIPLYHWIEHVFFEAGQLAYLGDEMGKINPRFSKTFSLFDDRAWQLMFKVPKLFSSEFHDAKDRLRGSLRKYFDLPYEMRSDSAWFTSNFEQEMRNSGLDSEDVASVFLPTYWG